MKKTLPLALASLLLFGCATETTETAQEVSSGAVARVMPMTSAAIAPERRLDLISFGSCLKQSEPAPILRTMAERDPDLLVLLGDNVYGDVEDPSDEAVPELVSAYNTLARREDFSALRRSVPLLTVWDDHDYGLNDAGGDFPVKETTEAVFEAAWALSPDDPRRSRPGIHTAESFGPAGETVQLILLDTRFFRGDLTPTDEKGAPGKERYLPNPAPGAQMLGAEQEAWLADVLREPADLRILVSSIQVIADGHGWEAWATMPAARERLYGIIEESGVNDLVVVSGDRHLAALYERSDVLPFRLVEMTASSLNAPQSRRRDEQGRTTHEAGPHRTGLPVYEENFGEIAIDWAARKASLTIRGMDGEALREAEFSFAD
jgi:alkaline phosphatase D